MADRLDLLLLGATGFTGLHCIPYIHKLSKADGRNLTWGVAGRSEEKLKQVLEDVGKKIEADLQKVPVVVVDINDEESLKNMAQRAKIVINCCGPYRFLGEAVVRACVEAGTHHVDVSGEPQYMEKVQLEQNDAAQEKGVYVVSACGLDSIPTDLGVVFLQQEFEGTLNSVVSYLELWEEGDQFAKGPGVNYGTWESAVYGLAHWDELKELRKKLFTKKLPSYKPKLEHKTLPHKSTVVEGWVVPFPGSDRSVVKRTQQHFYEVDQKRPVQIGTYFVVKSFWALILLGILGGVFSLFAKFSFGRKLLLNYPEIFSLGFFSKKQPSEEKIEKSWFQITFYGEGWKEKLEDKDDQYDKPCDKCIVGRVKGKNPGYGATCAALVLSAIVIATESDKMPGKGGVFPPGAAFAKTSLIKQLNENGVTFDIISQEDLSAAAKRVDLQSTPVILIDIEDAQSLEFMAYSARVVINCCGPFNLIGEPIVKACIASGTHHIDISAEPQFIEKTLLNFNKQARERGVYIVTACAFHCIPADMGMVYLQQQFHGTLNSVDVYWDMWLETNNGSRPVIGYNSDNVASYGTWDSFIHTLTQWSDVAKIRKELFGENASEVKQKYLPHKSNVVQGWAVPSPTADSSLIKWTQKYFNEVSHTKHIQANSYFNARSVFQILLLALFMTVSYFLTRFKIGTTLLLRCPGIFTLGTFQKKPVKEEVMQRTNYKYTFYGEGWSYEAEDKEPCDRRILGHVKGRDPYKVSGAMAVLSAIILLTEVENLPEQGGVFSPGACFARTSLIKQLGKHGVDFQVIYEKAGV
ncbi:hypothetical protein NQ315_011540 [Exocentrus adspersus]|uniref:Saccharopine dehydrogenase NADP binding domain-containing protein n=1 Tax=Exocentrus adspersus TaxID=1586481 RepID=A0AAV8VUX6_9CUCU|nr:hypothetical protein NQ315_011540 [Exocentrus adspersus]